MKPKYRSQLWKIFFALALASVAPTASANICEPSLGVSKHLANIPHAFELQLTRPDGSMTTVDASNYYFQRNGRVPENIEELVDFVLKDPKAQHDLGQKLKADLSRMELSFQTKGPDGRYNKTFKVPVHASPVLLEKPFYDEIVAGIGPVQRALRRLTQIIYSHEQLTVPLLRQELGLSRRQVPDHALQELLDIVQSSIYLEPKMIADQLADYPFHAINGFDAAINIARQTVSFFEYNAGTPSGLSNNIHLLHLYMKHLKTENPKLHDQLMRQLSEDRTFQIFKRTIESNAAGWTKRKGLSVIIGPGVYNAAHPDVEMISLLSGMPLVKPQELYIDRRGDVRYKTLGTSPDPLVTGIYGRVEEASLLQSSDLGIPLRNPHYADNVQLGQKLGLPLEAGVAYDFIYNPKGEITGVRTDTHGRPLFVKSFYEIGVDPKRPHLPPGNLATALLHRKVYLNGFGGRVLDDKKAFEVISRYIAPHFIRSGWGRLEIAAPPKTLERSEYPTFYADPAKERYVVKETDKSGGEGVYILVNLSAQEVATVVKKVQAHPENYIIQRFADMSVLTTTTKNADGSYQFATVANDLRIFTNMDYHGTVDAGGQSFLFRVANPLSASTNTSQGAGYGLVAVIDAAVRPADKALTSILPSPPQVSTLGQVRARDLDHFLYRLNYEIVRTANPRSSRKGFDLDYFAHLGRDVISLLGREFADVMSDAREFADGLITREQFHEILLNYRQRLTQHDRFPVKGVKEKVHFILNDLNPSTGLKAFQPQGLPKPSRQHLMSQLTLKPLPPQQVQTLREGELELAVVRTARVRSSRDPEIQEVIEELAQEGGEVHWIRVKNLTTGRWLTRRTPEPFFDVTPEGQPVIYIDLSMDYALTALKGHELSHFRNWRALKDKLQRERGLDETQARRQAAHTLRHDPRSVRQDEQLAVDAEMAYQSTSTSEFNRGPRPGPLSSTESGYINRISYPKIEALRQILFQQVHHQNKEHADYAQTLVQEILQQALPLREQAAQHWERETRRYTEAGNKPLARMAALQAHYFRHGTLFNLIFWSGDLQRFQADQTDIQLLKLFHASLPKNPHPQRQGGQQQQ